MSRQRAPKRSCQRLHVIHRSYLHTEIKPKLNDWYSDAIESNTLLFDPGQKAAVERFDKLAERLCNYMPQLQQYRDSTANFVAPKNVTSSHPTSETSQGQEKTSGTSPVPPKVPRGLYMYGSVGVGKSMLMDRFAVHINSLLINTKKEHVGSVSSPSDSQARETLEDARGPNPWSPTSPVRRIHFHAFMLEVHRRIHAAKQRQIQDDGRNWHVDTRASYDAVVLVGSELGQLFPVLCLDEFQVADVADAVILSRLFGAMWRQGCVLVTTSNRAPDGLYEGGLNRDDFLPFIEALSRRCRPHCLDGDRDFRIEGADGRTQNDGQQDSTYLASNTEAPDSLFLSSETSSNSSSSSSVSLLATCAWVSAQLEQGLESDSMSLLP